MTFAYVPSRGVLVRLDDADLMESAEIFEELGGVLSEEDLQNAADDVEENDDP